LEYLQVSRHHVKLFSKGAFIYSKVAMTKTKTQITIEQNLAKDLRVLAAKHNRSNSDIAEEAFRYCFSNSDFLRKLDTIIEA
jgi:hypothetical protein